MRLILELRSESDMEYDNQYHYNIQGLIYNLLKTSEKYSYLHDKKGYKFFCFSNIFPYSKKITKGDIRNLIISSPDPDFIDLLDKNLGPFFNNIINIGNMKFVLNSRKKRNVIFPVEKPFLLITGTPIIMRIHKTKLSTINDVLLKNYRYYYWRSDLPLEFFIVQLESTLIKKYTQYCNYKSIPFSRNFDSIHFFEKFKFKKQISTQVRVKNLYHKVIGTIWEFEFDGLRYNELIKFALDSGLGERNSLGFGFVNLFNIK